MNPNERPTFDEIPSLIRQELDTLEICQDRSGISDSVSSASVEDHKAFTKSPAVLGEKETAVTIMAHNPCHTNVVNIEAAGARIAPAAAAAAALDSNDSYAIELTEANGSIVEEAISHTFDVDDEMTSDATTALDLNGSYAN